MTTTPTAIICPYCQTHFTHNGHLELQECPKCHAKLITSTPGHIHVEEK